jgi:N-acetylglucosamine-6-phosphate deacetylase
MAMKCTGVNVFTGDPIEIRFAETITAVDDLVDAHQASDIYIAPGFIDLQINGFAGADYNSPDTSLESIAHSLQANFATGVTRIYPTVITGSEERITGSLQTLLKAKRTLPQGDAIEGFHVEGPHISSEDGPRGAHPARWVRKPDIEEFKRWQAAAEGHVRLITLAAEWPEAPRYIEHVVGEGVVISIGHTAATAAQIRDCVSAGATMSTHLGNGAHAVMARHPNYIWDQLAEDRLTASFIVDGIHIGDAFLKVAFRAKGLDRAVLITDAVMPAQCSPGPYTIGEVEVELLPPGDRVVLRGGTRLAGSALSMHDAVSNAMRMAGINLRQAVTLATTNAARSGRVAGRQRGFAPGERADFVRFRMREGRLQILDTWISGTRVFEAKAG